MLRTSSSRSMSSACTPHPRSRTCTSPHRLARSRPRRAPRRARFASTLPARRPARLRGHSRDPSSSSSSGRSVHVRARSMIRAWWSIYHARHRTPRSRHQSHRARVRAWTMRGPNGCPRFGTFVTVQNVSHPTIHGPGRRERDEGAMCDRCDSCECVASSVASRARRPSRVARVDDRARASMRDGRSRADTWLQHQNLTISQNI